MKHEDERQRDAEQAQAGLAARDEALVGHEADKRGAAAREGGLEHKHDERDGHEDFHARRVQRLEHDHRPHLLPGRSRELREASDVDGASEMTFFFQILVPICMPLVAVLALWQFVAMWNSYFDAMIYLNDTAKQPLQLVLRSILIQSQPESGMIARHPRAPLSAPSWPSCSNMPPLSFPACL